MDGALGHTEAERSANASTKPELNRNFFSEIGPTLRINGQFPQSSGATGEARSGEGADGMTETTLLPWQAPPG